MGTDLDGTAAWWQWMLFGIGAALVVAAAVVLTVASGEAATGLLGAIAVGTAKGALIGAAIGGFAGYISYTPSNITGFTKHGLNQVISRNGHRVNKKYF